MKLGTGLLISVICFFVQKYATDVIFETHEAWKAMMSGSADKNSIST